MKKAQKRIICRTCSMAFECPDNKRNLNRKYCSGYCAKSAIGKNNRGRKLPFAIRKLWSEKRKGENNNFFGRKHTAETKLLISNANSHGRNNPIPLTEKQI